jgi:hypothetical protein
MNLATLEWRQLSSMVLCEAVQAAGCVRAARRARYSTVSLALTKVRKTKTMVYLCRYSASLAVAGAAS